MKILKTFLKISGIALAGLVIVLLCFIGLANFLFHSDKKGVDGRELVKSTEFKNLHLSVTSLDSIINIAVLPEENYVVLNGIVINLKNRTFGKEPALGFYAAFYEEGNKTPYISIDSLFRAHNINLDSAKAFTIFENMKSTEISDISIYKEEINYRWKVSAMYGEEGIIYTKQSLQKGSNRFDLLENIGNDFYHFAFYD